MALPTSTNEVTTRKLSAVISGLWDKIKTALSGKVDKVSGKGLSTNDYTTTEKNKLAGIASGAEVNVQSDWNQATTTADDYIKNKPTIPSGTQLVYDCGTGSTSTTDFDNALAAYQAGKWVILHYSSNTYYCVGTYNSGLRFKRIANESSLIKINTVSWTKGSNPTGATLEAALVGHSHTNYVPTSRTINNKALTDNITLSASDVGAVTASKTASQGSSETSLVTRGEKYIWNNKQDALPGTWDRATGQTYGIALDEGGIDQSLKNISNSNNPMTADTFILVHDAVGETSYWKARHINKLWDWTKNNIGSVLRLYTRENNTPYFDGLAANAVQAIKTTNANITRTADVANGDKLQIGNGTAVNITNAGRANYADSAGNATSAGSATYATTAGRAYEDGNGATLAPLVINYNSGTFPDVFNQLTTAYVSKRRIYCLYSLVVAGSTDRAEIKIPLSSVRFSSSGSVRAFEFVTPFISRGSSSSDIAGQITVITVNHLDNGSYNWGIEFQWPYAANQAGYANTAGTANDYNTSSGTIKTALDGKASTSHTHGISSLSIGKVTVNGNFFVPRLPCYYAQGNINIIDGSIDIAAAAAANGFGTPLIVYNSTSSAITVQRSSGATTTIGAYKHKIFVRSAGDAIAFYDMMT